VQVLIGITLDSSPLPVIVTTLQGLSFFWGTVLRRQPTTCHKVTIAVINTMDLLLATTIFLAQQKYCV
jgi:hypothetical protein